LRDEIPRFQKEKWKCVSLLRMHILCIPPFNTLLRLLCEFFTSYCEGTQIYFFSVERDAADLHPNIILAPFLSMSCYSSDYFIFTSEMDNMYYALTRINCLVYLLAPTCTFRTDYRVNIFVIKPTRCTNITNLFCHETLHVSDSSSVHHQEFIHRTLGNGVCPTGL